MTVSAPDSTARRERLKELYGRARVCTLCPLHESRTQVVFGSGNADAELMFVGEAPGANEDLQGLPFVGQAGKLLDKLLLEIGIQRADVFIANCLKCRPPDNRDPRREEIDTCQPYLREQVALIRPTVICTLGNFSTKLLRGDPTGISKIHGQPEVLRLGDRVVRLLPLYHPAAALYTPSMQETLRRDFALIPGLLEQGPPPQPDREPPSPEEAEEPPQPERAEASTQKPEPGRRASVPRSTSASAAQSAPGPEPAPEPAPKADPEPVTEPAHRSEPTPAGPDPGSQLGLF